MSNFKKQLLFIIIGAAVLIAGGLGIWAVNNRGAGPIAWWKFDEGQGTTTYDASGNSNTGAISGATWQNEENCKTGKCLYLDGVNDVVSIGNTISVKTVAFWARVATSSASGKILELSNNTIYVAWSSGSVTTTGFASPTIYINGIQTSSFTANSWQYVVITTDTAINADSTNLGEANNSYFTGYLDEIKFFDYVRTASQIKADYMGKQTKQGASVRSVSISEQQDASEGLVAYWKMDESSWASGTATVIDSSGNGNTGTVYNGANTTSTAKFGMAGTFDGSNDYVSVSNTISGVKTIEFWLRDANATDGILELINNSTYISIASNVITATGFTGTPTIYVDGQAATALPTTGWHHIAVVTNTAVSAASVNIGEANNDYFQGQIDDVKFYNAARSGEQIRRDYDTGPAPVAYWRLDENASTTAFDTSGNGNNGVLGNWTAGYKPTWVAGKYGNALKFDGVDDYVDGGTPTALQFTNTQANTIEAWIYPTQALSNMVVSYALSSSTRGWYVVYDGAGAVISGGIFVDYWDGSAYRRVRSSASSITVNKWNHIVITHDGTNKASGMKIYINGVSNTTVVNEASPSSINYTSTKFTIGNRVDGSYFLGLIDDVRIYNYARTPKQIMEDMNVGHPAVGSYVGYWSFDEGASTIAYDKSVNKNNGTMNGTSYWTTNGKFGSAFNGSGDDYVTMGDVLDVGLSDFSIEAWVKTSATIPEAAMIVGKRTGNVRIQMYISPTGAAIGWFSDGGAGCGAGGGSGLNNGLWHHIVFTMDRDSSTGAKIFVDGQQAGVGDPTYMVNYNFNINSALTISRDGANLAYYFPGSIDEVKIYFFALSAAEIKEEFNRGASLKLGSVGGPQGSSATSSDALLLAYCVPGDTTSCSAPVLHIKMDEANGQYAYDSSGSGNTGIRGTGSSPDASDPAWKYADYCHSGSCLSFDGSNDYVSISNTINGVKTVAFWIKSTNNTASMFNLTSTAFVTSTAGVIAAAGFISPTIYVNGIAGSATLTVNTWQHIAVTTGTGINSNAITIGKANSAYTAGIIDDVRIYNYARTPAQIAYDYNRGAPVAWWKMNDGQNTTTTCDGTTATVSDSSGNSKTGTLFLGGNATSSAWSEAKYSCGLTFDGTNDYVAIGNTSRYDINTLSFWVKPNNTTQKLIELSATNTVEIASGVVTVTGFGTETVYVDGKPTTAFPDTNWHHITIVAGSDTQATDMNLGRNSTTYFAGILDDVRIYNYGLTATQVKTLYNQGSAVRFGPSEGLP